MDNLDFKRCEHAAASFKSENMRNIRNILPWRALEIGDEVANESESLEGYGLKIVFPSNVIDIYITSEVLIGLKLSEHADTLTEANNLMNEQYKRGETENEQKYRNAFDIFHTNEIEL